MLTMIVISSSFVKYELLFYIHASSLRKSRHDPEMCCFICGMQRHEKFHSNLKSEKRKDKSQWESE